jgi:hypothetical protein
MDPCSYSTCDAARGVTFGNSYPHSAYIACMFYYLAYT